MVNVRKAMVHDVKSIIAFLSAEGFTDKDIYSKNDYYVYYDNDALLGCGMSFVKEEYCIIENVIVDEKFRNDKIGTALVKTILNSYECNGAKYALSYGRCPDFCKSLGFDTISHDSLPDFVQKALSQAIDMESLYLVPLEGYFKGCS